jgi:glyoxylase-like metal-dependent hydrolase (beta-lactamase superfamily II)
MKLFQTLCAAALLALAQAAAAADLKVTDWAAKTGPLFPHSAIVEGETEIGIVDVLQSKSEAHRLVADVLEKGKKVRWVYVTHPHLDHFAGANIVRAAFPNAKFFGPSAAVNKEMARQVATRRLPLGQGTPGGAYNLPEKAPDYFKAVPKQGLLLDGQKVEVLLGTGDHPDSSIVWVPSAKTLIGGDVIFNRTHAFFGDHDDLPAWIALVERAVALKPTTVVAGHSKVLNPGGEIVAQQLAWLKDLDAAMKQHKDNAAEVKKTMVAKYPDYANDFIFEFSYGVKKARAK